MPTQLQQLSFDSLAELDDGRINRLVKHHLARIASDVIDRPADKTARKVTIDFIVKPIIQPDGECDEAAVEIECKSKIPTYRTKKYTMRATKGGLAFNRDFPDELDQTSLYGDDAGDE